MSTVVNTSFSGFSSRGLRALAVLCGLLVAWLLAVPVAGAAASVPGAVFDEVDALTSAQERDLRAAYERWGSAVQAQIGVVFISSVEGRAPAEVADAWFDGERLGVGAGRDAVMLLVAVHSRDMHILLNGQPYAVLPRSTVEDISDHAAAYFKQGQWAAGARVFGEEMHQALLEESQRFRVFGRSPGTLGLSAFGGAGAGAVLMFAGEAGARRKMRNVGVETRARQYVVPSSAVMLVEEDELYDERVSRTYIPPSDSSSVSSSSGSWSGGGSRGGYTSSF